ncbi:MAG: chemotaxis protein CheW, partial [candidate division Zixibacteria bacterium]
QEDKFLTFPLAEEEYGIDIRHVTEIVGIQNITGLPDAPLYVRGVINLRGKVIPVIDVRIRFAMEARDYDDRTCVIVVDVEDSSVGLIVDSVSEVIEIPKANIEPAPSVRNGKGSDFIWGLGKVDNEVMILLNTQALIYSSDLEMVIKKIDCEYQGEDNSCGLNN